MADEKKELILSVGFDLDRAEERKLKANLDKATGELEKQQREAKQLSQTLDELNKKREQLDKKHIERSQEIKANNASRENYNAEIDRANELRKEVVKLTSELKSMPDYDLFEADKEKVKALKDELKSMSKDSPQYDVFKQQVEAVTADFEKKYELYIQKDMELEKKKQAYNEADRTIVSHFNSENINTGDLKQLESELDEVNTKIGETEKKLGDVNAKINVTTANVEVAREKLKKAHTPKIPKTIKSSANELDRFGKRIKGLVKQAFIFGVIAKGLRTMVGYMGELLKSTPEYAEQLSQIKGNLMVTASSLWTALEPAISWLLSALNYLTQVLAVGVSTMLGQTREEAIEAAKAFDRLTKSSKKSTASLDTLHKLGDSSIMASYEALENIDEDKWAELAETFNTIMRYVIIIGGAMLAWKIGSTVLGFFSNLQSLGFKNGLTALTLTLSVDLLLSGIKDLMDDDPDNDSTAALKNTAGGALGAATIAKMVGASAGTALGIALPVGTLTAAMLDYAFSSERKEAAEKIDDIFEQIDEKYEDKEDNFVNKVDKFNEKAGTALMESSIGVVDWALNKFDETVTNRNKAFEKLAMDENGNIGKGTLADNTYQEAAKGLTQSNEDLTDAVAAATAAMERLNRFAPLSVPHIPKLATGTIIPPNNPYLAVVGDQRSGTNVEAPLETIVEAMRIALREQGSGRDITVVMEYDGREFGRAVYHANNEETQRVGVRLAKA